MMKRFVLLPFACVFALVSLGQQHSQFNNYLFVYFTGNNKGEEAIRFATSKDGYHYRALNNNAPVISSAKISSTGGVRDPHILRGADGKTFYMVATDMVSALGWSSNRAMVLLKSADLVNWTSGVVNIQKRFPGHDSLLRVWAPQTIYDAKAGKYMIYFSMKHGSGPDKIYYAYANKNFTDLESAPRQLFYHPQNLSCIDGDIVYASGRYHLFFKTEGSGNGIKKAVSENLTGGYRIEEDRYLQQTSEAVEGAGTFKLNNSAEWMLMYDVYMKGKYQFTKSKDLRHFTAVDEEVSMDFHPRHGTVIPLTAIEAARLEKKWPSSNNPVLKGYYADPDIMYSEKTRKYYIYPTSDGFTGWSGTYFKCFSSTDLAGWKDEGVILDLEKDVSWAKRNAWAPCIIEKKIGNRYKYFYYFTAAQKIGVAVSDDPAGPFTDSGNPLIDRHPPGINHGQVIDPDVFTDPRTGKSYLYWGNGYMAGVELNDDMVSVKAGTMTVLNPGSTFREGTHVFHRKGLYYFLWSENDTRDPDYRVRYGTSTSPLGKIAIPSGNIVIAKDTTEGIYATGHNTTIQIPGTDEWYLVYHRFKYPEGIGMGEAAGYNREVCIDKMEFNSDGSIRQVKPTHRGIALAMKDKDLHSWAPTPPMGWNSWDCFGPTVTESEVKANADYMAAHLKKYGWEYVVVDIRWYVANDKAHGYNETDPQYSMDEYGRFLPAINRFPSAAGGKGFRPLADYLHSKGLKFGIHIMRGVPVAAVKQNLPIKGTRVTAKDIYSEKDQCRWLRDMYTIVPGREGSQEYYNSLFELYASWGLDFVKVDDLSSPLYFKEEVEMIRKAIDRTGRKIILSTSPGETPVAMAPHVQQHANMWRTVGDFWDSWEQLKEHFEVFERWNKWRTKGAYPDGDMLPLGKIGIRAERGNPRMSHFTKDEQYTLMTLWSIFKSPLMFGGNLPDNDDFTLSLLTNKQVLDVLNRSTNNRPLFNDADKAAWTADEPGTGSKYLALFNKADQKVAVEERAAWRSEVIDRNSQTPLQKVDIDITGAKKLYLVVTNGGDNSDWDHADWIAPTLYNDKDSVSLTKMKWVKATSGWGNARVNKAVSGSSLVTNNTKYDTGIGVHSNSIIEFDLPGGYSRFKALAGLDQAAANQNTGATIQFMVFTQDPSGPVPPAKSKIAIDLEQLGITSACKVTDLWSGKVIGEFNGKFVQEVNRHGARLFKLEPK